MSSRAQKHQQADSEEGLGLTGVLRDCLVHCVLVVDRQWHVISSTPETGNLLRLKAGGTAGLRLAALPSALQKIVREVATTGVTVADGELMLPGPHDDKTLIHVTAIPIQTRASVYDVVVVLNDLTPARRLEQNLRRLDRLASIGALSASSAHEIKNALVAVRTFVELLLDRNRDSELTETVQREMQRIESIVRQMLKFTGPARPAFSPVRLHDVLDHSLRLVQRQIEGKLISLNRSFRAAPDSIRGNDHQLEQAFVNLFLNAVEAMGPNGSLQVATELVPPPASPKCENLSLVRVTISDTGVGVTPENMCRLFEPFFTTKHDGTGLGLPITQRIVREHHGDITVHSEPNKGTTFNILLPANVQPH
jgi:signal transduction histidine kinase